MPAADTPAALAAAPFAPAARTPIARAVEFLLARQGRDGLWRDYALEPGAADAWPTSAVALALQAAAPEAAAPAVAAARTAVAALARPEGWAYNAATACDADSTAWALRLLGRDADPSPLGRYLDADGDAHTFADPARFGAWSGAHADVTAVAGLALVAVAAPPSVAGTVRDACLRAQREDGGWRSYWWTTDAHATARNLEFLHVSGGVDPDVAAAARRWLGAQPAATSALDAAARLDVATLAGAPATAPRADLLARQRPDGGWPASATLLVPAQWENAHGEPHRDIARLLTTAAALRALAKGYASATFVA